MAEEEEEEVEMTYEEFLIYSARLGELQDVIFCIEEKVDVNQTDASGNTALRKLPIHLISKTWRVLMGSWTSLSIS